MGMFDWVRVEYPIAREHQRRWFQTTSIPGAKLRTFTLTRSGRLKLEGARVAFDGDLVVYDVNEDVTVQWTYTFHLAQGKLQSTFFEREVIGMPATTEYWSERRTQSGSADWRKT